MTDMTVAEVAQMCGVTERTVRRWLKEGRLAGMRVAGRVRISPHAVGELAAPYGEALRDHGSVPAVAREAATAEIGAAGSASAAAAQPTSKLRAYLEDPERMAEVRARRVARTLELLDRVRELAREHPAPPGALDPGGIIRAIRDEQDAEWDEWLG